MSEEVNTEPDENLETGKLGEQAGGETREGIVKRSWASLRVDRETLHQILDDENGLFDA